MNDFYIIICKDLHGAIGVFGDYDIALKAARAYTDGAKSHGISCIFLPVIIDPIDGVSSFKRTEGADSRHTGQYL